MALTSGYVESVGFVRDPDGRLVVVFDPSSPGLVASSTAVGQGRQTSTTVGTAVALTTTTACKWVTVTALLTNTTQVNVGASAGVLATSGASTGTPLLAGDSITLPASDLASVFFDVRTSGEGVSYVYG